MLSFTVLSTAWDAAAQDDVSVSKKPLNDFAKYVQEQISTKAVDLNASFDIELTGTLSPSGKLESGSLKSVRAGGDKGMVEMVRRAIGAADDSGVLVYLQNFGVGEVRISAKQDDSAFAASLKFQVVSEARAKTLATLLSLAADHQKMKVKERQVVSDSSRDDLILLESMKVIAASNVVSIDIGMAKKTFRDMIDRALVKHAAK